MALRTVDNTTTFTGAIFGVIIAMIIGVVVFDAPVAAFILGGLAVAVLLVALVSSRPKRGQL
ncbi:MAG: hypothetical protein ACRD0G_16565 [Acidimicrobiales bacterium]